MLALTSDAHSHSQSNHGGGGGGGGGGGSGETTVTTGILFSLVSVYSGAGGGDLYWSFLLLSFFLFLFASWLSYTSSTLSEPKNII